METELSVRTGQINSSSAPLFSGLSACKFGLRGRPPSVAGITQTQMLQFKIHVTFTFNFTATQLLY